MKSGMHRTRKSRTARLLTAIIAGVLLAGSATGGFAEEKPISVSADLALASKYVWRGLLLTDDPVLQPSLTFAHKGLSLNLWANTDLTDVNGTPGEVNEFDYTLDYSFSVEKVAISLGAIQYTFPHTAFEPTTEIYGKAGLDVLLSPTLSVYYDTDEVGGVYATLGAGHSFALGEVYKGISPSLDLSGSVGFASANWNEGYYGVDSSGLVDLLLGASLSIPFDETISVAPFVNYSVVLDSDLRDAVAEDDSVVIGATLSIAF